jgi:16S rRNA (cytidine1402-2'-O)-methyltransferase
MGTLFMVATPIGNLEDITLRALKVLREVDLIAAEDTRTTRALLTHHRIRNRLLSYNDHNMRTRTQQLLAVLERSDVALVSEAGTPGVSDPGHQLTIAALDAGVQVVAIPGASAVITALAASGLPMREFTFLGFLPRRAGDRRRVLTSLATEPRTLVVFESPHRLRRTLQDVRSILGDRRIAVCRELTKMFEEVFRGSVSEAADHFREPRGEFSLVIEGATGDGRTTADENDIRQQLQRLKADGVKAREAVAQIASSSGLPRRAVYRMWLEIGHGGPSR